MKQTRLALLHLASLRLALLRLAGRGLLPAAAACSLLATCLIATSQAQAPAADAPAAATEQPAPPPSPAPPPVAAAPAAPPRGETPAVVIDAGAADTLLGKPVQSATGEDMGRIVDVIVDRAGTMRAVVIDFGGFLGVGSRKIAVDWRVLHFRPDGNLSEVVAELPPDQLRVAPAFKAGEPVVVIGRADPAPAPQPPIVTPASVAAPAAAAPVVPGSAAPAQP